MILVYVLVDGYIVDHQPFTFNKMYLEQYTQLTTIKKSVGVDTATESYYKLETYKGFSSAYPPVIDDHHQLVPNPHIKYVEYAYSLDIANDKGRSVSQRFKNKAATSLT